MRYFLFIGILGLMHYYIACAKLVLALVYFNFFKEVRLGGWDTEGPKALTLGQYVSACATFPLGSGSMCFVLRLGKARRD